MAVFRLFQRVAAQCKVRQTELGSHRRKKARKGFRLKPRVMGTFSFQRLLLPVTLLPIDLLVSLVDVSL